MRILLVEDNIVNQKVAQHLLKRLGHEVDVAADGREAVAAIERSSYEAIFMDIYMPEMDGLEATRHIRKQYLAGKQPYIIAMTADSSEDGRSTYRAAGMDDYVAKPIRVEEMAAALDRAAPSSAS